MQQYIKKKKKQTQVTKSVCWDREPESKREFIIEMETEFIGGCMASWHWWQLFVVLLCIEKNSGFSVLESRTYIVGRK